MSTQQTEQTTDDSWKHEQSCWVASRSRGYNGHTVYWGPFATYAECEEWASTLNFSVSFVELKAPDSDPSTWWN